MTAPFEAIENEPEIQQLIAEYGRETTETAYYVAQSIGEKGFPGIDFSGEAEKAIREAAHGIIRRECTRHANNNLRGL